MRGNTPKRHPKGKAKENEMEKTKSEMRKEIRAMVSGLPGSEYQHSIITKVGRDYVHFISLYEGSKPQKIEIETFYAHRDLYDTGNPNDYRNPYDEIFG